ncbi:MAG: hypothetical protein PWP39_1860 [Pyrococcus sp.]|nr:hypothetical protein [Pyrococcus sp.]
MGLITENGIYLLAETIGWFSSMMEAFVVMKLSPEGKLEWAKVYGAYEPPMRPVGIEIIEDRKVLVLVAWKEPTLYWIDENGNITRGLLVKVPTYGYNLKDLAIDGNEIYLAGAIKPDLYEPFLIKLSGEGSLLWSKKFPNSGETFIQLIPARDSIYVLGYAGSSFQEGKDYKRHAWILNFDKNGKLRWHVLLGDTMGYNKLGGIAVGDYLYLFYFRNVFMKKDIVSLALGKDGSTPPCDADRPKLEIENLEISLKFIKPPQMDTPLIEEFDVKSSTRDLHLIVSEACSGDLQASPSLGQTKKTTTTNPSSPTYSKTTTSPTQTSPKITIITSPHITSTAQIPEEKTPKPTESEKKGICGPAGLVFFVIIPLIHKRY